MCITRMNFSSIFSLCVTLGLSARAIFSFRPGRFDQLLERSVVQEPILLERKYPPSTAHASGLSRC
jgi:hypothetical protein